MMVLLGPFQLRMLCGDRPVAATPVWAVQGGTFPCPVGFALNQSLGMSPDKALERLK